MTTPDELERLRGELDQLQRTLLETAARRVQVVRRIGEIKAGSQRPLFDRLREREVYARATAIAHEVRLDPEVARGLMQVLVESSHDEQDAVARDAGPADICRRFLIVGGDGRMGRLLRGWLETRGHSVAVLERDDGQDLAPLLTHAEIIVVAVPMDAAVPVAQTLAPQLRPDQLLCDINSLKRDVCAAMAAACPGEVVGLHPMFGPTVATLRRQKVVWCPVRPGPLAAWWREELGRMGAELVDTDPGTHDRMMAVVQVLVHYSTLVMGDALRRTGVDLQQSLAFTSPIYRLELAFVGRLFTQDPDLYAEIEMSNPHGDDVRRCFRDAAAALAGTIETGDRDDFRQAFGQVREYFHGFGDEAMAVSDWIIDTLVARP
jgi:chorismate mutase/prephenate dehydrogenase